jgi:hypothetical protein
LLQEVEQAHYRQEVMGVVVELDVLPAIKLLMVEMVVLVVLFYIGLFLLNN